jgi:predicted RND superfamily exporter protein
VASIEEQIVGGGLEVEPGAVRMVMRANRLLHDDDPTFDSRSAIGAKGPELLEVLALDGDVLSPWLNLDRSKVRIPILVPEQPYSSDLGVIEEVSHLVASLPEGWEATMSGEVELTAAWIHAVHTTQLRSFPTAALLVAILVSFFLGSLRLGLVALVPTLVPVAVTLGSMAALDMSLDVGRAMIGTILIGIGVDDAVHILAHYGQKRDRGIAAGEAVVLALQQTGRAVVTTSLALAAGFLTLMASAWQTISSFGFFAALSIVGALASSLLLLPALLVCLPEGTHD